jgi:WD40 repeat protein
MLGLTKTKRRVKVAWSAVIEDHVIALDWSGDGRYLAVAASTGPVMIFDAKTGLKAAKLSGHERGTLALQWCPTKALLITAGKDGRVRGWQPNGGEVLCLEAAAPWVEHIAWHPSGKILTAAAGRTIHWWDGEGELIADLIDQPATIADLAWKPGSETLAAAMYGGVMLWKAPPDETPSFRLLAWKGSPLILAWSPNAAMLAHGNQDSTVHFWYIATNEELQMHGYPTKVRQLDWDPASRYLATGGGSTVCIWDCGGTGPRGSTPKMLEGHSETCTITAVQFQHRGQLLASSGTDSRVCIWQPQNGKQPLVGSILAQHGEATVLKWSNDDTRLAVGYESGAVQVLILD